MQPHADEPARDDELLDAAVQLERALQPVGVDSRNEEVRVLRIESEQLVANGTADEVGIESE